MGKFVELSSRNKAPGLPNLTFYYCLNVIAFKLCFLSVFLEPRLQVKLFDAFEYVQTNTIE